MDPKNTHSSIVIAGAGLAGHQVGASLREMGHTGPLVLVGEEPYRPYQRPPLSKSYLFGSFDDAKLAIRAETFYADREIRVLTGRKVVALDRAHHRAALDDDTILAYDHFVFAVGARNRPLPVHGAELGGVYYLRTLEDARALKGALATARSAVVIGAGFIGLEFAAAAAKHGIDVTVIEVADRPMARALSPAMAAIFRREHARSGVRFMFNSQVLHILGEAGAAVAVETVANERVPADIVVIGIGVQPNVEVAAAAGLPVSNGIVVDDMLRTSDPCVSAVGDCASHPNPFGGGLALRLESVQNATDQGRCLAAGLLGKPTPYGSVPWFWSDQGDLKLQIAGLTGGFDQAVVRGDAMGTACSVFCFQGGRLLGVESVNRPGEHLMARRLIGQRVALTAAQAADEKFDLKEHLARETTPH
jgi:3-phenylpropionate/trans-cinnamate dioxygenase ferredoxin reductase subunit